MDTTVQEKAIAHPVDSRLLEIARHKVVSAAKRCGISLKQWTWVNTTVFVGRGRVVPSAVEYEVYRLT